MVAVELQPCRNQIPPKLAERVAVAPEKLQTSRILVVGLQKYPACLGRNRKPSKRSA